MTNYKWGPVPDDKLHGGDVNDYEALKADLKKMFILLKSERSLPAVVSERTNRRFCYQSPRGGRIDLNIGTADR
ncbi:hypothetical protein T03_1684 [Trichinella britovi]|uniref:Uncharacterized protein n=1 Tax=Trichinella britovi TaxID=45882 RepID=A0A0V1C9U3_TRIBR|nr:hypothetical protein T03_1684 [Trichinella britovi]